MGRCLTDAGRQCWAPSLAITGLSLGEGRTPLEPDPDLASWAGVARLWVKREDTNPTGSHKDRAAVVQIAACVQAGKPVAVISSSGNAALAAANAKTYTMSLLQPAMFGSTELKPGEYRIEVIDQKATVRNGKWQGECPVKLETGERKYDT